MNRTYLSLGSNRGNREQFIGQALSLINGEVGIVERQSPVYETAPWGFADPVPFLNCVAEVSTLLAPEEVMAAILKIEKKLGRKRPPANRGKTGKKQFLSRTIDIDILFYNDLVLLEPDLTIPHPEISRRRFVLIPLCALDPGFRHPVLSETVSELLDHCSDRSDVRLLK